MTKPIRAVTRQRNKPSNPLPVYLQTLCASGRRSITSLLNSGLNLLEPDSAAEHFPWPSLRYDDLVYIRFKMLNNGASIHTINTTLSAFRGVIRTAFNMSLIDADTMLKVASIKSVKADLLPAGRALSTLEVRQLLLISRRGNDLISQRNNTLLQLLIETGIRRDELVKLMVADFDVDSRLLTIRHGKGLRQRVIMVPKRCARKLSAWINQLNNPHCPLFCRIKKGGELTYQRISTQTVYNIITLLALQAGIGNCTPHDLRRTYITRKLAAGTDVVTVSRFAGHRDIKTTLIYDRRI